YVNLFNTGHVDENKLPTLFMEMIDLSPRAIRERLGLNKPIYAKTAAYGHFGRPPEDDGAFSWEKTDLVDTLKAQF
ncbi:MAG: methionine adenosyltransferase domain-containing protein, partial [Sphingomonadales bacterium]